MTLYFAKSTPAVRNSSSIACLLVSNSSNEAKRQEQQHLTLCCSRGANATSGHLLGSMDGDLALLLHWLCPTRSGCLSMDAAWRVLPGSDFLAYMNVRYASRRSRRPGIAVCTKARRPIGWTISQSASFAFFKGEPGLLFLS